MKETLYTPWEIVFAVPEWYNLPMKKREVIECKVLQAEERHIHTKNWIKTNWTCKLEALTHDETKSREFWLYSTSYGCIFKNKKDAEVFCEEVNKKREQDREEYIINLRKTLKYSKDIAKKYSNIVSAREDFWIELKVEYPKLFIDGLEQDIDSLIF